MAQGDHRLRSKSDFQRFCAELRTSSPTLDDLVEGLRDLAASSLRPTERGRFAHAIARHLGESFHASAVRGVASVGWPAEIAMALRSQAPTQAEPPAIEAPDAAPERVHERAPSVDLRELSRERGSPLTVVFMGDEDEHRISIDRLRAEGIHCLRESSVAALREAFERETVVGLVVGSSWWATDGAALHAPRQRLREILELSNLCWVKLVRTAMWPSLQATALELCMGLHFSHPPLSRFTIEDQAAITEAELQYLAYAAQDLFFAERSFSYDFQPSPMQDRILRAASSRYLRLKYPTVHAQESGFRVRALANRGRDGLASLVSVSETDVAIVVKVSRYEDALDEARRFRWFAHGASFEMEFFCHAMQGALVFSPMGTRLGPARSLEDVLASPELAEHGEAPAGCRAAIDAAIIALQRFSQQLRPEGVTTFCNVEQDTETRLASWGLLVVAGETIDPRQLFGRGLAALERCSRHAVAHGDAHPGNILFSTTGAAILIDYECAGLGPACYDLCTLWIQGFASRFMAVGDERSTTDLLRDLLAGLPFGELASKWTHELRFAVSREVAYLAHEALGASVAVMTEQGCDREDVYGIVAILLCRELFNPRLQQFAIRCALAAISSLLARPSR